jgi:hypothetical protein
VTDGEGKELSLMVGVNSGDGRGNITAYATVFDSKPSCSDRDTCLPPTRPRPSHLPAAARHQRRRPLTDFSTLPPHGGDRHQFAARLRRPVQLAR